MKKHGTKYHRDGTITVWNVYSQEWTKTHPSWLSARIWASISEEERKLWEAHEKKHAHKWATDNGLWAY